MRAPLLASLLLLASATPALADEISGRVVDDAGAPVAGASVDVDGVTAVTGDDGRFVVTLDDDGAGSRTVVVYADGFAVAVVAARPGRAVRVTHDPEEGEVILVEGRAPDEAKPAERTITAAEIRTMPGAGND